MTAVVPFALPIVLIGLLLLRQRIVVLLGVATFTAYYFWGNGEIMNVVYDMWDASNREILLSVPLYILAGAVMSQGESAARLVNFLRALMRPVPGGLGMAAVLSCAIFGAVAGSSIVTLLAVGSVMYPALMKAGYDRRYTIGMLCAGGTLGIIIPPSITMILYGVMTQVSIADLFIAGVGPSILLVSIFGTYSLVVNWKRGPDGRWSAREIATTFVEAFWSLLTQVIVIGGIYTGYFTPTESAAVALFVAVLVEWLAHDQGFWFLISGQLRNFWTASRKNVDLLWRTVGESSTLMGGLFPVLALALSLNVFLTYEQVPSSLVAWLSQFIDSKFTFLVLVNLFLLVVGCFIDAGSAILILSPILPPMAQGYGIDPTHFGIIMTVTLEIGYLTPPMGLNLIVAMAAFKEDYLTICKSVIPFIIMMFFALWIVAFYPPLSLFLIK